MKNTFWRDAAKAGLIIGAVSTGCLFIKTWLAVTGLGLGFMFVLLEVALVAWLLYKYGKQRSMLYDSSVGYTYGQNMSFVMGTMLLAGIVYGVAHYFLVNYIAADFFEQQFETSFQMMYNMMGGNIAEQSMDTALKLIKNPIYWLFYGVCAMAIYGGIIGLFVSAFVKRQPDVFRNNNVSNTSEQE